MHFFLACSSRLQSFICVFVWLQVACNLMFQVLPMFIFQHLPKECLIHPLTLGLRRQSERRLFGFAHSLAEFCFHDSLLWFQHRHVALNDYALQVA